MIEGFITLDPLYKIVVQNMSFTDQAYDEVRNVTKDQNSDDSEQEELNQIDVDMGSIPFVKFYPTTLVSGVFPENEGNPIIRFPDQARNGRKDQGYIGLVLDDLEVVTDEDEGMSEARIVETDADDSTEYRVVNFADENTTEKFGGEAVSINGDQYGIEDTHTSLDERVILVVDRTASQSVARKLDVNGGTYADMDEETGDVNGGLIEYAFTNEEGQSVDIDGNEVPVDSRYARNVPELRDEFFGERIGVMVTRRSDADSGATGYVGRQEQHSEPVVGYGENETTHSDPSRATYEELTEARLDGQPERRDMMWYTVFDMESEETVQPVTADGEGSEPVQRTFLQWRFDPSAGNLPEDQWEFVQTYIESGAPTDEETIRANVEDNLDDFDEDPNTDRIVGLIQSDVSV